MSLTDQQRAILAFIQDHLDREGMPPTQLEICAAFGFRQNATANYHLRALEDAGVITRTKGRARSIRLTRRHSRERSDRMRLPVLGRVAAGNPIEADFRSDEELLMDRDCFALIPDYLLRVQGDSMREDGILDGDLVAVKRANEAHNGQIVVARIDGEITIKRLKRTRQKIVLLPRNPHYAPIEVPADADFAIEGLYCGLVRQG